MALPAGHVGPALGDGGAELLGLRLDEVARLRHLERIGEGLPRRLVPVGPGGPLDAVTRDPTRTFVRREHREVDGQATGAGMRELGVEQEVVEVDDAGFTAGRLLTGMMGSMHLSRTGVSLREASPGAVTAVVIDAEQVRDACVRDALAVVGARGGVTS